VATRGGAGPVGKEAPTEAASLLFVGMKRGLLRPHFPHRFSYLIKCRLVGYTRRQALIVLDLPVELVALLAHVSSAFARAAVIGRHR
jgi:hypothetical protein